VCLLVFKTKNGATSVLLEFGKICLRIEIKTSMKNVIFGECFEKREFGEIFMEVVFDF
jgi:hypothetical protein